MNNPKNKAQPQSDVVPVMAFFLAIVVVVLAASKYNDGTLPEPAMTFLKTLLR